MIRTITTTTKLNMCRNFSVWESRQLTVHSCEIRANILTSKFKEGLEFL